MKRELTKIVISPDGTMTILDYFSPLAGGLQHRQVDPKTPQSPRQGFPVTHLDLHFGEEPFLTGGGATVAVYFERCNLKCKDCTNLNAGSTLYSEDQLFLEIGQCISRGGRSTSFVSPTLYWKNLLPLFKRLKTAFPCVPLIYNCGGYESFESIASVAPWIDIFLPDCKAVTEDGRIERNLPAAYRRQFMTIFEQMIRTHEIRWNGDQLMRGVVVRHLLTPNGNGELRAVLEQLSLFEDRFLFNVMTEYYVPSKHRIVSTRPDFYYEPAFQRFHRYVNGQPILDRGAYGD